MSVDHIRYLMHFTVRSMGLVDGQWMCVLDPGGLSYALGEEKPDLQAGDSVVLTLEKGNGAG